MMTSPSMIRSEMVNCSGGETVQSTKLKVAKIERTTEVTGFIVKRLGKIKMRKLMLKRRAGYNFRLVCVNNFLYCVHSFRYRENWQTAT